MLTLEKGESSRSDRKIKHFYILCQVPEDIFRQVRCTYLDDGVPVTLQDLRTAEFGDWQAYMNGCMAAMLKETKEKYKIEFFFLKKKSNLI